MKKFLSVELTALAMVILGSAMATRAHADSVLLLGNGDDANTEAAKSALLAGGHTSVTIGSPISTFDGTGLSGYNAVVLLDGDNTTGGYDMSSAGQTALLSFINSGGGLVTSEWSIWGNADHGYMSALAAAFPVTPTTTYDYASPITYSQSTANSVLDNGLPSAFTFNTDDDGGTETQFAPKAGATVFFTSSGGDSSNGLIGWNYGSGKVISFSTLIASSSDQEMADPNYSTLFSNSVTWAEGAGTTTTVPLPASVYGGLILTAGLAIRRLGRTRGNTE